MSVLAQRLEVRAYSKVMRLAPSFVCLVMPEGLKDRLSVGHPLTTILVSNVRQSSPSSRVLEILGRRTPTFSRREKSNSAR